MFVSVTMCVMCERKRVVCVCEGWGWREECAWRAWLRGVCEWVSEGVVERERVRESVSVVGVW